MNREAGAWKLYSGEIDDSNCQVKMGQDTAWRLLTKGLSNEEASARIKIIGDNRLGEPMLGMLAVMA